MRRGLRQMRGLSQWKFIPPLLTFCVLKSLIPPSNLKRAGNSGDSQQLVF